MAGLSAILDVSRTAKLVSKQVRRAGFCYRAGELLTEEPAMSHVVGQLRCNGQRLPIGPRGGMLRVTGRLGILHRAAKNKADVLGSDLAVRVIGPKPEESKTAFIQIKMHDAREHRYECPQEVGVGWIDSRRFVASIGRKDFDTFVVSIAALSSKIKSKTFKRKPVRGRTLDLGKDLPRCELRDWVQAWLSCTSGPADGRDAETIEGAFRNVLTDGRPPTELGESINAAGIVNQLPAIWIEYSNESDVTKGPRRA